MNNEDIKKEESKKTDNLPTIEEKTKDFKKYEGFFTFYWDDKKGELWLEIDKFDVEFLYVNMITHGIGSNNIGLDRGQLGESRIVKFHKVGVKVLMIEQNYNFRADSGEQEEIRAVKESFAESVLWGFKVEADSNNKVLVNATDFCIDDALHIASKLENLKQGNYEIDKDRSAIYLPNTKNFPKNTEFDAILTLKLSKGSKPGNFVKQVVPTSQFITIRQHYSFIQLPDNNYKPREFDPRAGYWAFNYMDFSSPMDEPPIKRFIFRHRLKKKDPSAKVSEAVEPIIYYVDRAIPEPIRSAIIEGASWWNEAFESIGYKDAFQVKLLPEDADIMDVRYNTIQWVHRATRGWSYGSFIHDPRTGEIIKGCVSLGSLRDKQDFLIAQSLLSPFEKGKPVPDEMKKMALARLKVLSVHEVGHTLGLAHNFCASANNRMSVMDYAYPLIQLLPDGTLDFSKAYEEKIGKWDKVAIEYGYQDFPPDVDESKALQAIVNKIVSEGLLFISDVDAQDEGGAHPTAHSWDNGPDAVDELYRLIEIRKNALSRFSENAIKEGKPMATLEDVLVLVYMFHRYQLYAVAKIIGGLNYTYTLRGDGQIITEIVSPKQQRRAVESMLATLKPDFLALPEDIIKIIPPRPIGYFRTEENFSTRTSPAFDPLSVCESSAQLTVSLLLNPKRAGRLVEYHSRNPENPGLVEVVDELIKSTWRTSHSNKYYAEIQRVVNNLVLYQLMDLANDESAGPQVKAIAYSKLDELKGWLTHMVKIENDANQQAHFSFALSQITQFQNNPLQMKFYKPVEVPPGAPI